MDEFLQECIRRLHARCVQLIAIQHGMFANHNKWAVMKGMGGVPQSNRRYQARRYIQWRSGGLPCCVCVGTAVAQMAQYGQGALIVLTKGVGRPTHWTWRSHIHELKCADMHSLCGTLGCRDVDGVAMQVEDDVGGSSALCVVALRRTPPPLHVIHGVAHQRQAIRLRSGRARDDCSGLKQHTVGECVGAEVMLMAPDHQGWIGRGWKVGEEAADGGVAPLPGSVLANEVGQGSELVWADGP